MQVRLLGPVDDGLALGPPRPHPVGVSNGGA